MRGAFAGTVRGAPDYWSGGNGGTVFLDEIGDMPMSLQAKLLRVLQEQQFQRLGSSETVRVDVRIVAATNTRLEQLIREGRFREDLYLPAQCGRLSWCRPCATARKTSPRWPRTLPRGSVWRKACRSRPLHPRP